MSPFAEWEARGCAWILRSRRCWRPLYIRTWLNTPMFMGKCSNGSAAPLARCCRHFFSAIATLTLVASSRAFGWVCPRTPRVNETKRASTCLLNVLSGFWYGLFDSDPEGEVIVSFVDALFGLSEVYIPASQQAGLFFPPRALIAASPGFSMFNAFGRAE